jgi:hypothetical protein
MVLREKMITMGDKPMSDPKVEYHFNPPAPSKVVTLAIEARDKMLAEARAEEREACCRDVCPRCEAEPHPIVYDKGTDFYYHLYLQTGERFGCYASAIRQRAAKEHNPS